MKITNVIKAESTHYDDDEDINIRVVSLNLIDFNNRFNTDIVLYYEDEYFTPFEKSDLADYFISTIPDLLFMAHNPFNNEIDEWKEWIKWRKEEREKLFISIDIEIFNKRYIEYCPLDVSTNNEVIDHVKCEMNKLILSL